MLDRQQAAGPQPVDGPASHRRDDRHTVDPAEQRVRRIMPGNFGFQHHPDRDIRRVGDHQIDPAVEFGQQARVGHVPPHDPDPGRCCVTPRIVQRGVVVVDRHHPGAGSAGSQRDRQRTRTRAQVQDHRIRRKLLRESPFQERLGFRARNEHAGAHLHLHRTEGRSTGDVLQRNPLGPGRDRTGEALVEAAGVRVQQRQPAPLGAGRVRGQELGIGSRRVDAGLRQCRRSGGDRLAHARVHACCSRDCLSAAARASSRASRSPSMTWSRLWALKLIR